MAKQRVQFGPSKYESSSRSWVSKVEPKFKRTSARETFGKGGKSIASMLGAFDSRGCKEFSSKEIPPRAIIHDLDPHAFSNKDVKKEKIDTMLVKNKKKDIRKANAS